MTRRFEASTRIRVIVVAVICSIGVAAYASRSNAVRTGVNPLTQRVVKLESLEGRVVERLVAGPYLYLSIDATSGRSPSRVWAVVLGDGPALGRTVRVTSFGYVTKFFSERLDRTFDELLFATVNEIRTDSKIGE